MERLNERIQRMLIEKRLPRTLVVMVEVRHEVECPFTSGGECLCKEPEIKLLHVIPEASGSSVAPSSVN